MNTVYMFHHDETDELVWVYWADEIDIERLRKDVPSISEIQVSDVEFELLVGLRRAHESAQQAYRRFQEHIFDRRSK